MGPSMKDVGGDVDKTSVGSASNTVDSPNNGSAGDGGGGVGAFSKSIDADGNQQTDLVQEVMGDNLDMMLEVVMMIREDKEFAKNIYANCPRLQHLLDQHPDLRPVFEDPNLVRLNFEEVYKKAGGLLPEDKPPLMTRILAKVVNHPLFKVFKFLLLIKKCYNCVMGGGIGFLRSCLCAFCADGAIDELADADLDDADLTSESAMNKEALFSAADHMEEPETQERMQQILESDPDERDEMIEDEPELKALRDSGPLCEELMNDPETMKILVDPDNLRALAECPDYIEADFADPDWTPPDVETPEFDEGGLDAELDDDFDNEGGGGVDEVEEEGIEVGEDGEVEEEDDDGGLMEDYERGDETEGRKGNTANKSKAKQQNKKKGNNQKGGGGFMSTIGTGFVDYLAAETIGMTASEMMGGGDDGLGGVTDQADQVADEAADQADNAANAADFAAEAAEFAASDDVAGNLEDTMDGVEETQEKQADNHKAARGAAVGGAAAAGAMMGGPGGGANRGGGDNEESDEEDEEEEKKKGRFGFIGGGLSALATAAKEHVATAVLGDDFGEDLVERLEEDEEEEEDDGNKKDKEKEKKQSSRRGLFGKKK